VVGEVPDAVPKMQLSPEIGELQICRSVFDFSKLSDSDPDSDPEPLSECSLVGSSIGSGCESYWCMSSLSFPRYGWMVRLSCSSLCHCPRYSITAVGLPCSLFSGMYSQMLYPLLLAVCPAGTSCTPLLVWLLGLVVSCHRIQMCSLCLLPVPLELAMIERSRV
jgi:hypothetical protein